MFVKLSIRDLIVVALCVACWVLVGRLHETGGILYILAALAAVITSYFSGYFGHEWGHLLGASLAGSTSYPANKLTSFFLFRFDTQLNSARQFLSMAAGGLIASTILLVFWFVVLPLHTLAGIAAIGVIILGYLATLVTELPVVWRIAKGAPLPQGALFSR